MANGRHDDEQALIGNDSDSPKIVEGTTNHPVISPSLRPSRQDGKGYIDERPDVDVTDVGESVESEDHSGSSIEEDIEEEGEEVFADEQTGTPRDGASEHSSTQVSPSGLLDTDDDKDEDEKDWEVEDEDWEMAHGDFTKHYNRLRQQHAAVQSTSSPMGLTGTTGGRPPLPARNFHQSTAKGGPRPATVASRRLTKSAVFTGGVPANPKSSLDRQDKDKSDRATHEQVLDSRTRLALSALTNRGVMGKLGYCISTGKEANVYYAAGPPTSATQPSPLPHALAVKIYRTSILNFRSRQNYIIGEHRFRGEYTSAKNPRKMVRVWAEKEMRNLRRLEQGGIRAPRVFEVKENVLVMEFLGDGQQLKDAEIPVSKLADLYVETLVIMRQLYQQCKLVHADLSEYNILYHDSHLYIIDVSQSVEHDHPRTFDFLRSDIRNINDFFARRSVGEVKTLGMRQTWDFIVGDAVDGLSREDESGGSGERRLTDVARAWLNAMDAAGVAQQSGSNAEWSTQGSCLESIGDEAVFMSSFIPRSLREVHDPERDVDTLKYGQGEQLIYVGRSGMYHSGLPKATDHPASGIEGSANEETFSRRLQKTVRFDEEVSEESLMDGKDLEDEASERRPRGFRFENKEAKKARKQAVKDEKREKRTTKMPKADKQRLVKKTSAR